MIRKKEVPLKIELFSGGEESQFMIRSKKEIQSILQGIVQECTCVALYYGGENEFILTTMLNVNEQGILLELGPIAENNTLILQSNEMVFISSYHSAKVQFAASYIKHTVLKNGAAFYIPLPEHLLRIQRREHFRLTTLASRPLKCIFSFFPSHISPEVAIVDISGGGMALVCDVQDTALIPDKIYQGCKIQLSSLGTIIITVKVQNSFEVTLRNGQHLKRAGCAFTDLSNEANLLLQRFVAQLQSELRSLSNLRC